MVPATASAAGGTPVTIEGSGFAGIVQLDFMFEDGTEGGTAGKLVVSDDASMTCETPVVAHGGQAFLSGLLSDGTKELLGGSNFTFQ
jgi:hypothetical protein